MVGFGQRERPEHLSSGEGLQPSGLLLGAAEEGEGAQGQPALHGQHGAE